MAKIYGVYIYIYIHHTCISNSRTRVRIQYVGPPPPSVLHHLGFFIHGTHTTNHCVRARSGYINPAPPLSDEFLSPLLCPKQGKRTLRKWAPSSGKSRRDFSVDASLCLRLQPATLFLSRRPDSQLGSPGLRKTGVLPCHNCSLHSCYQVTRTISNTV